MAAGQRTRSALVLVDILDRVANRRDFLGGIVGDLDAELFLERHHQLDDVEAVGAEIVDEARVLGHLVRLDAEMFDDDLLHPIGSLAHGKLPPVFFFGRSPSGAPGCLQVAPIGMGRYVPDRMKGRSLTAGEIHIAKSIFGDAIAYQPVRLFLGKWWPFQPKRSAMAPTGSIWFHPDGGGWSDDFSC